MMWTKAFVADLCLVCSRSITDFSLSNKVSTINLFRNNTLSNIGIKWLFIFLRIPTIRCKPMCQSLSNSFCDRYPLSATILPRKSRLISASGARSSTLPVVSFTAMISPLLFITRCSLKPKNHLMLERPRAATPLNTRLREIR